MVQSSLPLVVTMKNLDSHSGAHLGASFGPLAQIFLMSGSRVLQVSPKFPMDNVSQRIG